MTALVAVLVAVCVFVLVRGANSLTAQDAYGAAAGNDMLVDKSASADERLGRFLFAGNDASKSTTPEIRAAAKPNTGPLASAMAWNVDYKALAAACTATGMEVIYPAPSATK